MITLKSLSDRELLARINTLRRREHKTTLEVLLHLHEIERRRLHLKLGFSSLFTYCTNHLNYSASAAGRRIQAARCVRRFPDLFELLHKQKVTLMSISLIAPILNDDNTREILAAISGKTQREVEAIASRYRPPVALRDRVMPVRVHVAGHSQCGSSSCSKSPESSSQSTPGVSHHSQCGSDLSNMPTVVTEQKVYIQFLASEEFMQRYEEVRSLLSQRLSVTSFASVFEVLINEFLDHHSPVRRKARREAKIKTRKSAPVDLQKKNNNKLLSATKAAARKPVSSHFRHIPAAVRDEVFVRDHGRCTYIGATGERCGSTQALQIDHIVPFARGGTATANNLRLLCAQHNRLAAAELFGETFTRRFHARELSQL